MSAPGAPPPTEPLSRPRGARSRRSADEVVAGALLLALALGALAAGWRLPVGAIRQPGPGFFPLGLVALLAVLAVALIARGLVRPGVAARDLVPERPALRRVVIMMAALLGYVAIVETTGYVLSTAALLLVLLRGVGGRGWPSTVGVTVLGAVGSWLLFARALRVSLPSGAWLP